MLALRNAFLFVAALGLAACRTPYPLQPYPASFLSDLVERAHREPLNPGENLRAREVHRNETLSMQLVQVREGFPSLVHRRHEEIVVILEGEGMLNLAEERSAVRAGTTVFIPAGMAHGFQCAPGKTVVALAIFVPPDDGKDTEILD